MDDIDLKFNDDAYVSIAKLAILNKTGARGLRTIMEKFLEEIMFHAPDLKRDGLKTVLITAKYIETFNMDDLSYTYDDNEDEVA